MEMTAREWIARCSARLQQQWRTVDPDQLDDLANDLWADLGSGGGSPALPIKIARPASTLTMVEAMIEAMVPTITESSSNHR